MICTTDFRAPFLTAQALCSMASSIGVRKVWAMLLLTLSGDSGEEREREWGIVGKKGREWGIVGKKGREWGIVGKRGERVGDRVISHTLSADPRTPANQFFPPQTT